jgi:hypothetical protein
MEPLIWSGPGDAPELWDRFNRDGVCWVRMHDAIKLAALAPDRLLENLLGWTPLATHVNQIKVAPAIRRGVRPYAVTNDEARFHVDQHPYLPAALQVLVCVRQASDPGGASMFIDTWKLLDDLAQQRSVLFERLFETPRTIRFHNFMWCSPTFSVRAGNLVCVHNGFPLETDPVGKAFQQLIERQAPIRFKLETGDLLLSNNHRTLHARTAFSDTSRHLIRILTWLRRPLVAPVPYVRRAIEVAVRTEERVRSEPLWIRKRIGYSGFLEAHEQYDAGDLLAHYRGELAETVDQQAQLMRAYRQTSERRAS